MRATSHVAQETLVPWTFHEISRLWPMVLHRECRKCVLHALEISEIQPIVFPDCVKSFCILATIPSRCRPYHPIRRRNPVSKCLLLAKDPYNISALILQREHHAGLSSIVGLVNIADLARSITKGRLQGVFEFHHDDGMTPDDPVVKISGIWRVIRRHEYRSVF